MYKNYSFLLLVLLLLQLTQSLSQSLSFLVIGDWGGRESSPYTTAAEVSCAKQMGIYATSTSASFTVALGDNFYTYGVKNEYDSRFKTTFEDVFTAESLNHTWYVIAGNHDHYGNVSGEIAYTAHSQRWHFPNTYYSKIYTFLDSQATVEIIYIDTVLLSGISDFYDPIKPYEFIAEEIERNTQWDWIESQLNSSKADWLLVAGHYPVWSIAEHGPTSELVKYLKPMLLKYKVTAYLCGHDHNMQHLREENTSVDYFVIGAGHLIDSSTEHQDAVPKGSLKFHYGERSSSSDGAFASISATKDTFSITYVNVNGKSVYHYSRSDPRRDDSSTNTIHF